MEESVGAEKVVSEGMAYVMVDELKNNVNDQENVLDVRAGTVRTQQNFLTSIPPIFLPASLAPY